MTPTSAPLDAPGDPAGGVLVIGYGNVLRSDDGVGWHAAALLADDPRVAGVEVLAVHQLTPELALDISRASLVILVDAAADVQAGLISVQALGPEDDAGAGEGGIGAASHHVGPAELVAVARELYAAAPKVLVMRIGVADMELGEALSPPVAAALPAVVEAVVSLVARHRASRAAPP